MERQLKEMQEAMGQLGAALGAPITDALFKALDASVTMNASVTDALTRVSGASATDALTTALGEGLKEVLSQSVEERLARETKETKAMDASVTDALIRASGASVTNTLTTALGKELKEVFGPSAEERLARETKEKNAAKLAEYLCELCNEKRTTVEKVTAWLDTLENKDVDLNGKGTDSFTYRALNCAIKHMNVKVVELLLARGADLNVRGFCETTPLIAACENGACEFEIVQALLDHGADPNLLDQNRDSAMTAASSKLRWQFSRFAQIIQQLYAFGADLKHKNNRGHCAHDYVKEGGTLRFAASDDSTEPFTDSEEIENASLRAVFENTSLMVAIRMKWTSTSTSHLDHIKKLIAAGSDVNHVNPTTGFNALIFACMKGDSDVVRLLIDKGADVKHTIPLQGVTALHFCGVNNNEGSAACARAVINAGADINAKTSVDPHHCKTSLMIAAERCNTDCVMALIEAGADLEATNDQDETALYVAVRQERFDSVKTLVEAGAVISPILPAEAPEFCGNEEIIAYLEEKVAALPVPPALE